MTALTLSCVVVTMGDRADELVRCVESLRNQASVGDILVVWNGCGTGDIPGARSIATDHNVGVPAARHIGLAATSGDVVFFLDDDAYLPEPTACSEVISMFASTDDLAAVGCRIADEDGASSRRHNPRFGRFRSDQSGSVATFLGGACALRRSAYADAGGYWPELFYGHEELDLSWRLLDRGWTIGYRADVRVIHPRTEVGRHRRGWYLTGRNRVAVARRDLPAPIALVHVIVWLAAGVARSRSAAGAYLAGWIEGWRTPPIERRPIRWRTVWQLARLGRPPVV